MGPISYSLLLGLTAALANVFGGALVEMVPQSVALRGPSAGFLVLAGYLVIHFFEHTLTPHFHYGEETHADEFVQVHKTYSVLAGLAIHALFDGIAIASGFLVSNWLGWIIFVAVFLHKVPEGFTVSSVMLAGGRTRTSAWTSSLLLGLMTLAGAIIMVGLRHSVGAALPLSAGVTLYVAASDLVPEVNREPGIRMALVVFVGVAVLFVLDRFLHLH